MALNRSDKSRILRRYFPGMTRNSVMSTEPRECRHIHRHSRESGNPKAIGSNPVIASYRILGSRFRGNDGNRRLETDILKLTTLPRDLLHSTPFPAVHWMPLTLRQSQRKPDFWT